MKYVNKIMAVMIMLAGMSAGIISALTANELGKMSPQDKEAVRVVLQKNGSTYGNQVAFETFMKTLTGRELIANDYNNATASRWKRWARNIALGAGATGVVAGGLYLADRYKVIENPTLHDLCVSADRNAQKICNEAKRLSNDAYAKGTNVCLRVQPHVSKGYDWTRGKIREAGTYLEPKYQAAQKFFGNALQTSKDFYNKEVVPFGEEVQKSYVVPGVNAVSEAAGKVLETSKDFYNEKVVPFGKEVQKSYVAPGVNAVSEAAGKVLETSKQMYGDLSKRAEQKYAEYLFKSLPLSEQEKIIAEKEKIRELQRMGHVADVLNMKRTPDQEVAAAIKNNPGISDEELSFIRNVMPALKEKVALEAVEKGLSDAETKTLLQRSYKELGEKERWESVRRNLKNLGKSMVVGTVAPIAFEGAATAVAPSALSYLNQAQNYYKGNVAPKFKGFYEEKINPWLNKLGINYESKTSGVATTGKVPTISEVPVIGKISEKQGVVTEYKEPDISKYWPIADNKTNENLEEIYNSYLEAPTPTVNQIYSGTTPQEEWNEEQIHKYYYDSFGLNDKNPLTNRILPNYPNKTSSSTVLIPENKVIVPSSKVIVPSMNQQQQSKVIVPEKYLKFNMVNPPLQTSFENTTGRSIQST